MALLRFQEDELVRIVGLSALQHYENSLARVVSCHPPNRYKVRMVADDVLLLVLSDNVGPPAMDEEEASAPWSETSTEVSAAAHNVPMTDGSAHGSSEVTRLSDVQVTARKSQQESAHHYGSPPSHHDPDYDAHSARFSTNFYVAGEDEDELEEVRDRHG